MDLTPKYQSENFLCPHCNIASQQKWFDVNCASEAANNIVKNVFYNYRGRIDPYDQQGISKFINEVEVANNKLMPGFVPRGFSMATCSNCGEVTLWINQEIVYPKKSPVAPPNIDMEPEIQDLYLEASTIVTDSPKGATALLRLALQLLLRQLGKSGGNINNDIKELVADGLSPKIQQALDLLRVVGNNAVHPGQIDLNDGLDIAIKLFQILNFIADEMLSKPKELERLYGDVVPDETKQHINERDGK